MELYPLPGQIDVLALQSAGEFRRVWHGPRTLQEVLQAASDEMDREDALRDGYVQYLAGKRTGIRHPRKRLRAALFGR